LNYRVVFTNRALKDFKKIDKVNKKKIILKLKDFSVSPSLYSKKLINPKIGTYRFKIGNFRVIFDIDDENIIILRVGDRKEIYR
jgi:mRNA interferase RelE/StbE